MEKANLNNPLMSDQNPYNSPPSYDQAEMKNVHQHQPQPQPPRPNPSAPQQSTATYNYPYNPLPQTQPIYPTNYQLQQSQPLPPSVMIVQSRPIILGPHSSLVTCPFCQVANQSRIKTKASGKAHLSAALCCVFGCWCCCCIPYCMRSCLNVHHYCANCKKFLGTYYGSD